MCCAGQAGTSREGKIVCAPLLHFNNGQVGLWGQVYASFFLCLPWGSWSKDGAPSCCYQPCVLSRCCCLGTTFGPDFPKASCPWFVCSVSTGHAESVSCGWKTAFFEMRPQSAQQQKKKKKKKIKKKSKVWVLVIWFLHPLLHLLWGWFFFQVSSLR